MIVDYTSRIAPASLKAAGVSGVCRYLSYLPSWKVISQAEYDELEHAGIQVTLNWEYSSTDWLGGASLGAQQGTSAGQMARSLGYPVGRVIVGSADFNASLAQWPACQAYAVAYSAAVRSFGYRPGMYGSYDLIQWVADAGIMDVFWQSMSTSYSNGRNGRAHPLTHLWQRRGGTIAGVGVDVNDQLSTPLWGTPPKGQDMALSFVTITDGPHPGGIYLSNGFRRRHLLNMDVLRRAAKAFGIPASDADIKAIPILSSADADLSHGVEDIPGTAHGTVTGTLAIG